MSLASPSQVISLTRRNIAMIQACETTDLLVFSPDPWDYLVKRSHHLMERFAQHRRVFFVEPVILGMTESPRFHIRETSENVLVVIPYLPSFTPQEKHQECLTFLMDQLLYEEDISEFSLWYSHPAAYKYTSHLKPNSVIYDLMEEVSYEDENHKNLLEISDAVFTSSSLLVEEMKGYHFNVHFIPGSVDYKHFSEARQKLTEPDDQINIPQPRIGFYGIIDDKVDLELVQEMASQRPECHFVMLGPVKINPALLPRLTNIHYLGKKDYYALPLYLAGWKGVILPFKVNESTRFLSPVKILESIAAGKKIISTLLPEVAQRVHSGVMHMTNSRAEFSMAIQKAVASEPLQNEFLEVDSILKQNSWDAAFKSVARIEQDASLAKKMRKPHIIEPISLNLNGAH